MIIYIERIIHGYAEMSVYQDISRASKANECIFYSVYILFNTRNKFHISNHPCIAIVLFII